MDDLISYSCRIRNILILKSRFISDLGLFNGKTGIAITFAHLYEYTNNDVYYECMSELLDDVLEHTYRGLGLGFASGFSGLGWGIEYLIQKQFVEGNSFEICEEIDRKIMETNVRRIVDLSIENGLEGLLHYVLIHLSGRNRTADLLPFDEMYLYDLYITVQALVLKKQPFSLSQLIYLYINWFDGKTILDYSLNIMQFVDSATIDQTLLYRNQLGLRDGLSGLLLKQLYYEKKGLCI